MEREQAKEAMFDFLWRAFDHGEDRNDVPMEALESEVEDALNQLCDSYEKRIAGGIFPKFKVGQEVFYVWRDNIRGNYAFGEVVSDVRLNEKGICYDFESCLVNVIEAHVFATREEAEAEAKRRNEK